MAAVRASIDDWMLSTDGEAVVDGVDVDGGGTVETGGGIGGTTGLRGGGNGDPESSDSSPPASSKSSVRVAPGAKAGVVG